MDDQRKQDRILLARIEELADACRDKYMMTHSEFLDLRQRSLVQGLLARRGGLRVDFYGGFDEAERVIAVFLPEYVMEDTAAEHFAAEEEENPLAVLRMAKKKGAPALSHRDYLGALMGLGIRREVTGDILVREDGADVIVLRSMADYIRTNLSQAGRSGLSVEEAPVRELIRPDSDAREKKASVASLRLDSVVGAAFGLSRSKALEAVRSGIVFVNGLEIQKPGHMLEEGDKVVMRHKGRAIVKEVGGKTGRGRIHVTLLIYR